MSRSSRSADGIRRARSSAGIITVVGVVAPSLLCDCVLVVRTGVTPSFLVGRAPPFIITLLGQAEEVLKIAIMVDSFDGYVNNMVSTRCKTSRQDLPERRVYACFVACHFC